MLVVHGVACSLVHTIQCAPDMTCLCTFSGIDIPDSPAYVETINSNKIFTYYFSIHLPHVGNLLPKLVSR